MGKLSRTKGKVFERKVAKLLREEFPEFAEDIRRSIQSRAAEESDVTGIPNVWLELQDAAAVTPLLKLLQAEDDRPAATWFPVAVTHKKGTQAIDVTMRQGHYLLLAAGRFGVEPRVHHGLMSMNWASFVMFLKYSRPWDKNFNYDWRTAED